MTADRPATAARIASAEALRAVSTYARELLGDTATPMSPAERVTRLRRLRLLALQAMETGVLAEFLDGASPAEIAGALGRDEATVRAQFAPDVAQWQAEPVDPARLEADAASLDAWYEGHREDTDPPVRRPVGRLLDP